MTLFFTNCSSYLVMRSVGLLRAEREGIRSHGGGLSLYTNKNIYGFPFSLALSLDLRIGLL